MKHVAQVESVTLPLGNASLVNPDNVGTGSLVDLDSATDLGDPRIQCHLVVSAEDVGQSLSCEDAIVLIVVLA